MIIRKTQQPSDFPTNSISNAKTTGTTNTYSCDYINGIVESGSNENGDWVKYMDGTMICTKRVSGTTSATRSWGPLYEGEVNCGIYPKTFIDTPKITAVSKLGRENIIECFGSSTNNSTFGTLYFLTKGSNQSCNYSFDLIAIGKWK